MEKENGVYFTPCTVNGLKMKFIFDTGASNVCISIAEATFMLKNGYLNPSDIKGATYSQIANGETIQNTSVLLKEIVIGGIKIYDVEAVIIHDLSAPLLLGQSAIKKLGKIQLENDELIIFRSNQLGNNSGCQEATKLANSAKDYFFKELFSLACESYEKAYDLCPESISCSSMYLFGKSEYLANNYELSLKYLEKTKICEDDSIISLLIEDIFYTIGYSYYKLGDYKNSILNFEKSLLYTTDNMKISSIYFMMGIVNYNMSNYQAYVDYLEKSIQYYCSQNKITIDDAMKGNISDEVLGERYFNLGMAYASVNLKNRSDNFYMIAAICGYKYAEQFCYDHSLDYKKLREFVRNPK